MSSLVLCVSCERHVRLVEQSCPFCGAALPRTKEPSGVLGPVLTRAALLVAGAAAGLAASSCAEDPAAEDGNEGDLDDNRSPLDQQGEGMAQPAYGVPIDDAGLAQPAYGIPVDPKPCDPPLAQPAYGVPIVPDAGPPLAQPAYGVPVDRDAGAVTPVPPPPARRDASLPLPQPAYGVPIDVD